MVPHSMKEFISQLYSHSLIHSKQDETFFTTGYAVLEKITRSLSLGEEIDPADITFLCRSIKKSPTLYEKSGLRKWLFQHGIQIDEYCFSEKIIINFCKARLIYNLEKENESNNVLERARCKI